jgi:hypothetical protein
MVRRRYKPIRQINLRITEPLRRRLEIAAKERQISTNQLMGQLLETGLEDKLEDKLANYFADLKRDLRNDLEHNARETARTHDPEPALRRISALEAELAHIQTRIREMQSRVKRGKS